MKPTSFEEFDEIALRERRIPLVSCDSPIEDAFLWDYKKVADTSIKVDRQCDCITRIGRFRLDFLLLNTSTGRKVGIECDGKDFHSAEKDSLRDEAIVATGAAEVIYRLRGRDLTFRMHDTLQLLRCFEPSLFSERGFGMLADLCRPLSLRIDTRRRFENYFDHGIVREYRQPQDSGYDGWEDSLEERPMFPTIIYWTQVEPRRS